MHKLTLMHPVKRDDLQYRINLKFEEAIFGVEKQVKYNREELCHTCGGFWSESWHTSRNLS